MTFKFLRERAMLSTGQASKLIGRKIGTIRVYECSSRLPSTNILLQMQKEYKATDEEILKAYEHHKKIFESRCKNGR